MSEIKANLRVFKLRKELFQLLARMYIGSFLTISARYLLVAVAPLIFLHGGASSVEVGLLVGISFLVQMIASPALGNFVDNQGRKKALLLGVLMMAIGGIIIFLFPTMLGFIIGQILFGTGPAAFFGAAFATVADLAPKEQRGSAMARFGILICAAEAVAPPIGLEIGFSKPHAFLGAAIPLNISI
ncbi:MFS transporter [Paenibacillus filicis]|uniref:MFS transporter n=1 Tax=Paenibacillus gyeongsangnamensis TaxID=3388067 RepID=A0ABT4QAV6_9BACL|nr:MFS transporter [Paenibacillus filicis]MCZ8513892.1 MFS transporter [Paenibacillus filicis]